MSEVSLDLPIHVATSLTHLLATSSGMTFFSNQRMSALVNRIGTDVLTELVEDLESLIVSRVCSKNDSPSSTIEFQPPLASVDVTSSEAEAYIDGRSILPLLMVRDLIGRISLL